ncbi:MAG: hypothetical protein Sapg2KO_33580 [Saprospiraceae bacterium]
MKWTFLYLIFLFPVLTSAQIAQLKVNLGHTAPINSLRFSSDSRYLVSSSEDQTMKLWEVTSGKLLKTSPAISSPPFNRKLFYFPAQKLVSYFTGSEPGNWYNWTWELEENTLKDGRSLSPRPTSFSFENPNATPSEPQRDFQQELWDKSSLEFDEASATPIYFTNGVGQQHRGYFPNGQYLYRRNGDTLNFFGIWEEQNFQPTIYPGLTEIFSFNSAGNWIFGSTEGPKGQQITIWNVQGGQVYTSGNIPDGHYLNDISLDGKYLLVTNGNGATSLYDLAQNQLKPIAEGQAATSLSPMADSRITCFDQALFSPDGEWIARGGIDGAIYLHKVSSGKIRTVLKGYTEAVVEVNFNEEGTVINCELENNTRFSWDLAKRLLKTQKIEKRSLTSKLEGEIGRSRDQELAMVKAASGQLELWSLKNNQKIKVLGDADAIAPNNTRIVRVDFSPDKSKVFFYCNLIGRRASITHLLWDLEAGKGSYQVPISLNRGSANSVAFSPDGKYLLIGHTDGEVSIHDIQEQKELNRFQAHDNDIRQISFATKKNKLFITSTNAGDGTVKLWELGSDEALASLINLGDEDWVVVGSDGLFDASQGAMQLLFYEVENNGNTEIVELEQLKARYYEPGLLQKILGMSDERIRSVEGLREIPLYPSVNAQIENDQLSISLGARSGGIGKVSLFANGKEIENDLNPQRQTFVNYDLRKTHPFLIRSSGAKNTINLRVFNQEGWLKSGAIDIPYQPTAWARGSGSSDATATSPQDPSMYVLTIGTSNYNGDRLDLNYADQDATIMARAIEAAGGRLFPKGEKLKIYCLTTANQDSTGLENTSVEWRFATKKNIQAVLKNLQAKAKPEDIIVLYLSGHGLSYGTGEANQFYYLTHEISSEDMLSSADARQQYTVSSGELTEWMKAIPALKQVLVIDACNSGKVIEELSSGTRNLNSSQIRALDRMKDRTGMFVLSGSAADKVSYEASEFGQGLLTYSLLQGMRGVATRQTADGNYVDVMKLFQYARDEVPRLAESISGIQTPMLAFPNQGASFDIGIVDGSVDIPIANKKPVIIRSKFLNQETLEDDLDLEGKLEAIFRQETEKGKNADFIYVNVPKYPGAFKLSGLYTKDGDKITINVKLFEEGGATQTLEIPATDSSDRLIKLISRVVKKGLK